MFVRLSSPTALLVFIRFAIITSTVHSAVISPNIPLKCSNCRVISSNPDDRVNIDELDKQGHRGCRGLMPENTVVGMLKALELGVTTLEMDTVITKDGHVILSHEPFFNHEITTSPEGAYILEADQHNHNIYRMIYSEIKQYDVGLKLHPRFSRQQKLPAVKPLLRDVFTAVKSYCQLHNVTEPFYNIETKTMEFGDNIDHPVPSVSVDTLMRVIEDAGVEERVIVQSFDFRTLQYLHGKYPSMKTAMLVDEPEKDNRTFSQQLEDLGFTPTIHSPHHTLVTSEMVEACHRLQIKIVPWTMNDLNEMQSLINLGVDGIITDYPDIFSKLVTGPGSTAGSTTTTMSTSVTSLVLLVYWFTRVDKPVTAEE